MFAIEIAILLLLILFNGFMAMSELAVVSARPARLQSRAEQGEKAATKALRLAEDPGRFLSTVQIGITLVGVLSGAFSGATLGVRLSEWLMDIGLSPAVANPAGVGLVVAVITYVSLVAGELVPKQIALKKAEDIAIWVAPFMLGLSKVALPLVWLLDMSGRLVLAALGQSQDDSQRVTDEEIRSLIAEAERSGTIETAEKQMISGVMRLADRKARAIMTPRGEVEWIDINADAEAAMETLRNTEHTRLPAGDGSIEQLLGVINTRELLTAELSGKPLNLREYLRPAPVVLDFIDALDALETLREAEVPMALVHDEYGSFEGLITPADILEAIAGVFRSDLDEDDVDIVQRADGSWLLPGLMPVDEMADQLGIRLPPDHSYATLAGFLLSYTQEMPRTGEVVEALGWHFEIVDLDGRRIDRVIAKRLDTQEENWD